jgi:uncharacterized protein (TIGR02271 family)
MASRTYITAIFPDIESARGAVPSLAGVGVLSDDICAAIGDPEELMRFCRETGAIPCENAIAAQLQEAGVSVERAAHCEQHVRRGDVLLLFPAIEQADNAVSTLSERGVDVEMESGDETMQVPLHAEKLHLRKRLVSDGEVRVRKVVTRSLQHVEIPLTREELVVTRQPSHGAAETVRIPLQHEEVLVRKQTIVTNEVTIRRESVQDVQHISEPVLRESLQVHRDDSLTAPQITGFDATSDGNSSGSMTETSTENDMDLQESTTEISAFFPDQISADTAAQELRSANIAQGDVNVHPSGGAGFLEQMKRFFTGEQVDSSENRGAILTVLAQREAARPIIERYGGRIGTSSDYRSNGYQSDDESGTMKLHEERLNIQKQPEKQGEVRLTKDVVTSQEEVDVPVMREEVVLNRRRVDEPDDDAQIGENEEIRIPVMREDVSVEKRPVVTEEVGVEKRGVQRTEHVSATVQKERARLETEGRVGTTLNDVEE